ncbi:LD-carboxypeptidase [Synechococcus sp. PROS-U-1]|uniref:S66 peptidase family protein n=1 Tax=Synechococcus sp. PROS-U-1 TaxID=1400866 RepID=UPI001647E0AF|nr:LD-carboxypeptidase [Synechococcus sp. PROS-U-1]QNJ03840.1 LD-carboxypeptidase family protein [Synechococcus sp. PROS-U-1]
MQSRRTLLISGASAIASTVVTALLSPRAMGAQGRLAPLKPGARIRAVNPGTWMDPDTDLQPLIERCDAQKWHLEIPATVTRQWRYFSGTDRERISDLAAAWNDPTVDAVLTLGGGWGAARVLEAGFRFPRRPKWSLGFSDTSSLLLAQWAAGLPGGIHGSSGGTDAQWQRTVALLRGEPVAPLQGEPRRRGIACGPLVVTNLTVATHLIGTPWLPSLKGAILVLEDVGEAPYRVDRMLTQWRSAGLLEHLAGVACGRFSWAQDDILPGDFTMEEILEERLGDLGIPLVLNLPMGHGRPNQALPLGSQAQLDGQRGLLSLLP